MKACDGCGRVMTMSLIGSDKKYYCSECCDNGVAPGLPLDWRDHNIIGNDPIKGTKAWNLGIRWDRPKESL